MSAQELLPIEFEETKESKQAWKEEAPEEENTKMAPSPGVPKSEGSSE